MAMIIASKFKLSSPVCSLLTTRYSASVSCESDAKKILGIRREDGIQWERRAPLSPKHIKFLTDTGVQVLVQPSNKRAISMLEYERAGAVIQEDLSAASLIMGVKQVPISSLLPEKTYSFFSHTIKAQEPNMPLLDAMIDRNIRIIDYERILDDRGKRLVAFGKWAGVAGMVDILHGIGLRLLALGHHTPFLHICLAHNYRDSSDALQAIRDAGYEIALGHMPESIGPLTFVFTGSGNVSQGAQEIFKSLPHEFVKPSELERVSKFGDKNKLYACVIRRQDYLVRKSGGAFDVNEFTDHPERYESTFPQRFAPYISVLINGIYYAVNAPRLLSFDDTSSLLGHVADPTMSSSPGCPKLPHRLLAICDISADPGGSIEFMDDCTSIDVPFTMYDSNNQRHNDVTGNGVLVCSIDNMPAQMPRESTEYFGNLLLPFVPEMLISDARIPFEQQTGLSDAVRNAVIASNGKLTSNYDYIQKMRIHAGRKKIQRHLSSFKSTGSHKILLLGSGYISSSVIDYLSRDKSIAITVASDIKQEADMLAKKYPNTMSMGLNVKHNKEQLSMMVQEHDLVVSLLPWTLHPIVAEICLENRKNMVTSSYATPQIRALDEKAKAAGVSFVMETGLDPGIDHMLTMEAIDEIKEQGGVITSFMSLCGGIPAPECADNALRYKFSWSPIGSLIAGLSPVRFKEGGDIVDGDLAWKHSRPNNLFPAFQLEAIPNRDSLPYKDHYGIDPDVHFFRGTIRYRGFSDVCLTFNKIGLLSQEKHPRLVSTAPALTWRQLICDLVCANEETQLNELIDIVENLVGDSARQLQLLGLFSDEHVPLMTTPLESFSTYLATKLRYAEGERDMVLMKNLIGVKWRDGTEELRSISMIVYGSSEGVSAMSKCVGTPTGIATRMALNDEIVDKGVVLPLKKDMYKPMLKMLKREGIVAVTKVFNVPSPPKAY